MNKRGISAVVTTVLIILITVASITIVWVAIIPMIQQSLGFSGLEGRVSVVSSEGYTIYDAGKEVAVVQIKRDVDGGVMNRIRIVFSIDGNSIGSSVVAPDSGMTKVYTFNFSGYGEPESVSVVPIFVVGTSEREGPVTSEIKISSGGVIEVDEIVYELGRDYGKGSCLELFNAGNDEDGIYEIDPDGFGGGMDSFEVYCDMTTDGGGWTLVVTIDGNDQDHSNVNKVGTTPILPLDNTKKLADTMIVSLMTESTTASIRFTCDGSDHYFKGCEWRATKGLGSPDPCVTSYTTYETTTIQNDVVCNDGSQAVGSHCASASPEAHTYCSHCVNGDWYLNYGRMGCGHDDTGYGKIGKVWVR